MDHNLELGSRGYLIEKTRTVLLWRGLGVVSGFVLDAAILACFGLSNETDAFFAGLAIPFLIDSTLNIQFTQVIIPMLASIRAKLGDVSANLYLSNVITVWLVAVSILAATGMILSKLIIPLQVPGLSHSAISMACQMNMLLVWLVPLCGLASLLGGALYSSHYYGLSSTKTINNVTVITVTALAYRSLDIYALAVGYLAGAAAQCIVLWVALVQTGFRFQLRFDIRDLSLRETAKLVVYPLVGQMLGELRTLLENFCASFYAPGMLSALRYASRIIHAISGVLMSSVITAITPVVAVYVADGKTEDMKKTIRNGVKLLIFISTPVCLLLAFEGEKLIRVLFERGKFVHANVALTSQLVALMTPYIFFSRAISLTQTPFYAAKDTKALVVSMIWGFFLYLALIPIALYGLGIYGFPLATSLAAVLGTLVMCILIQQRFGPMQWGRLGRFWLRVAGASVIGSLGFIVGNHLSTDFGWPGFIGRSVNAAIPSLLGLTSFGLGSLMFGLVQPAEVAAQFHTFGLSRMRRLFSNGKSLLG